MPHSFLTSSPDRDALLHPAGNEPVPDRPERDREREREREKTVSFNAVTTLFSRIFSNNMYIYI
jgi:hypothetical protein